MRRGVLVLLSACGHLIDAPDADAPGASGIQGYRDSGVQAREETEPRSDSGPVPLYPLTPVPLDGGSLDAGPATSGELIASSVQDFSGNQGEKSWTYGHIDPNTSPSFQLMTGFDGITWTLPSATWLALDEAGGIPDGAGVERWPVRRWTSTVAGPVAITLRLYKLQTTCGNGMDGRLFVDGVERWTRFVAFGDAAGVIETVRVDVAIGTTVDLALDPHGDGGCDRAFFSAVIRR